MKANYEYPLELDWTTDDKIAVTTFLSLIEEAYEHGVSRDNLLAAYRRFKDVVPDKGGERRLGHEFEEASGYSLYRVMQAAKDSGVTTVKMRRVDDN